MELRLSAVVVSAYDSIVEPLHWQGMLDEIVHAVDARAASLLVQERGAAVYNVQFLSSAFRELQARTGSYYLENLARYEEPDFALLARQQPGDVLFDTELGDSIDRRDDRPDYKFMAEHVGIGRRFAFRLNQNRGFFDAIAIGFDRSVPRIPNASAEPIRHLNRHLAKAMELSRTFRLLKQKHEAVLSALDHFGFGVAIAIPTGELIVFNANAQQIFEQGDALRLAADGRLVCTDPAMSAAILSAINRASCTAAGRDDVNEVTFRLDRRSGRSPIVLDIAPVSDSRREMDVSVSAAVIILIDPDETPSLDTETFGRLFGLTSAEREVCALMVEGRSTNEIADIRSTSPNTAHSQINSVLAKTGCNGRVQLVRLIGKTIPPIV